MDPRHPELALPRLKELIKQYDRVEKEMSKATTSAQLSGLEREGSLVVQEMCLVAPRIHEAMMQASRQRRQAISRGQDGFFIREATKEEAESLTEAVKEVEKKAKKAKK